MGASRQERLPTSSPISLLIFKSLLVRDRQSIVDSVTVVLIELHLASKDPIDSGRIGEHNRDADGSNEGHNRQRQLT